MMDSSSEELDLFEIVEAVDSGRNRQLEAVGLEDHVIGKSRTDDDDDESSPVVEIRVAFSELSEREDRRCPQHMVQDRA
jgi:hypothetical protein